MAQNSSYEPMDIDLSSHSNYDMDISFEESLTKFKRIKNEINALNSYRPESLPIIPTPLRTPTPTPVPTSIPELPPQPEPTVIKKYHLNMKKQTTKSASYTKICLLSIFLGIISILYSILHNIQCIDDLDLGILQNNLTIKLFGQNKALNQLIHALNADEKHKVIFIYGGTGVGKTYTSSILLEQTKDYYNVNHYTMPSFGETITSNIMLDIYICKNSLIIVDDLTLNDKGIDVLLNNLITKTKNMNKNVTVILIYNCQNSGSDIKCDKSFSKKLLQEFKQVDAYKKAIKYNFLNKDHLRKCIESELKTELTNSKFEKIEKYFDVITDGCKGVHNKMKLLEMTAV